jgi:hypothetical protein
MASFLLSTWVNPNDPNPPKIPESDPRWVGLWWVGFLCSAGIMFIFFTFMVSFPERLPDGPFQNTLRSKKKTPKNNDSLDEAISESQISLSLRQSETTSAATFNSNLSTPSVQKQSNCMNFFKKFKGMYLLNQMNKTIYFQTYL